MRRRKGSAISRSTARPLTLLVRVNDRPGRHPFLRETNVTGAYPPLGLAYLAAALREAQFPVRIMDTYISNLDVGQTVAAVAQTDVRLIGLTATTFNWPLVADLARQLRATLPGVVQVLGGPQLTLYPEECLRSTPVDLVVIGEGEQAIVEIAERLSRHEELDAIAGTARLVNDKFVREPTCTVVEDLDVLPWPALDLLPLRRYFSLTVAHPFISMVSSRGCPFHCRFCAQVFLANRYRQHSPARVVAEMTRAMRDFGAREIVMFDETFALDKARTLEICECLRRALPAARWNIRTRIDLLDEQTLKALAQAGCCGIHVGIESGDEHVQQLIEKDIDLRRAHEMLAFAQRVGVATRGYFMIGFPGETRREIERTIAAMCLLPLDWASVTITRPLPGTDFYREALATGRFVEDYWRNYTLGRIERSPGYFTSEQIDERLLETLLRKAYYGFYLRPSRLVAIAMNRRLWRQLPQLARTWWLTRRIKRSEG